MSAAGARGKRALGRAAPGPLRVWEAPGRIASGALQARARIALGALAVALVAQGTGCGASASRAVASPSAATSPSATSPSAARLAQGRPGLVTPRGRGAGAYTAALPGGASPPNDEPLRRELFGMIARAAASARVPVPAYEPRLQAVADELARHGPSAIRDFEVVRFLQSHAGDPLPDPMLFVGQASAGVEASAMTKLVPPNQELDRRGSFVRVGIGVHRAADEMTVVVALQEQGVRLEEFPRSLAVGRSARLRGEILGGRTRPEVAVTTPGGQVERVAPQVKGARFVAAIACDRTGAYGVELLALGRRGPEVLANFTLHCGAAPPRQMTARPSRPLTEDDVGDVRRLEEQLFAIVNRDRAAAGRRSLAWHGGLAAIARGHSEEMARTGEVGHTSPRTGNAEDRVARAGVALPSLLAENVGVGGAVEEMQRGFLTSPGHRANVLHAKVTHVGLGIAVGRSPLGGVLLYVTQLFAAVP